MNRRVALMDRLQDDEFISEVRAYLCDALPVDLLYRAAAALGSERDRDTARLKRLLEKVLKDLRLVKATIAAKVVKENLADGFIPDRLAEFDQVSKGRVGLPQESVEALHGILCRVADRSWKEHRESFGPMLEKWLLRDYREVVTGWRFSEDYDEAVQEAERANRARRVQPWGALQRLIAGLRMVDPQVDKAAPPGAPLAERRLRTFVKLFADPRDAGKIDPSADALKPFASGREEAARDLLRVHNYLLDQLERSAAADEALAAFRRRLRLAGPGVSLSQDLLRFLFDAGFVPVTVATLSILSEAEPLAGAADVLPLAIVTAPKADADADHPVFVQARNEVAQVMRRTGTVGGYVVALNGAGYEMPKMLECAEGTINVFRM